MFCVNIQFEILFFFIFYGKKNKREREENFSRKFHQTKTSDEEMLSNLTFIVFFILIPRPLLLC